MKTLNKTILVACAIVIATGQLVLAQDSMAGPSSGDSAQKQQAIAKLEKMSAQLQLTPAQKKQMLPILMQEGPKLEALKSNTSLGPLQKARQMKEIGTETDSKVRPILSPEQYQKWEAMRAQERQQAMQKLESRQ